MESFGTIFARRSDPERLAPSGFYVMERSLKHNAQQSCGKFQFSLIGPYDTEVLNSPISDGILLQNLQDLIFYGGNG